MESVKPEKHAYVSIGVIAWNEERAIVPLFDSLFRQTLFEEFAGRNLGCEVFCVANGCTDRTAGVAAEIFERQTREHPYGNHFKGRVANLTERGKLNAWNQFVHSLSSTKARFLFLIDADIILHEPETLWNMLQTLEANPETYVSVDSPRKDISFNSRRSLRERLSLNAGEITGSASAQLCAQLYCIRSEIARNIYLPKDLGACEDGFIKQLVCTDFLTSSPNPGRIQLAQKAEHTFEAYTSPAAILKNQKRQMIGQTVVHILIDKYLKTLPLSKRGALYSTLLELERNDPLWLKRLIDGHLKNRHFWDLYPGLLGHRLKSLSNMPLHRRLKCFPAAAASSVFALTASWLAYRALKAGTTNYWPCAKRAGVDRSDLEQHQLLGVQTRNP